MVFVEEGVGECVSVRTVRDLFQILQLKSLNNSRLNVIYGVTAL